MATKTATRKPAKPIVREETAEVVIHETATAEATARELAVSFASENLSKDERLFDQARIAFAGIATGAKPNDIAKATAKVMSESFPEADRAWAEATSVVNGGAKVSRVTIVQRSDAYGAIMRAGITEPTVALVALAFRAFTSKGAPGLAEAHTKLIKDTLALPVEARADHYANHARAVSAAVVARKKASTDAAHSERAATASADRKAEKPEVSDESGVVFLPSASAVIDYIRAELARDWSEADRADIMAALSEIVGE